MTDRAVLDVRTAAQWQDWLELNHREAQEI